MGMKRSGYWKRYDRKYKKFDVKKASKIISQTEHTITVDLGTGKQSDFCYGCDLSKEYVTINAEYHN